MLVATGTPMEAYTVCLIKLATERHQKGKKCNMERRNTANIPAPHTNNVPLTIFNFLIVLHLTNNDNDITIVRQSLYCDRMSAKAFSMLILLSLLFAKLVSTSKRDFKPEYFDIT